MRTLWVDENNDLDVVKARSYGFDGAAFSVRDSRVTETYLAGVRALGFSPCVYAAWNWKPTLDGPQFATWLSRELERIAPKSASDFPRVFVDIETHSVPYILGFLTQWRKHRRHRVTDWTLEGFQGGLFSPRDTIAIAASGVGVFPQPYKGDMTPTDPVAVVLNLCAHSFAPGSLGVCYDAAHLPPTNGDWTGYAFTQGRLP